MERRTYVRWIGLVGLLSCCCSSTVHVVAFVAPPSNLHKPLHRGASSEPLVTITRVGVVDEDTTTEPTPEPKPEPTPLLPRLNNNNETRVRRLRDLMWIRETLEDLTAAEFAVNLDRTIDEEVDASKRRKRAVDYDKLLMKLNRRIMDLGCERESEDCQLEQIVEVIPGKGMGRIAYTDQQRADLFNGILRTRAMLMDILMGNGGVVEEDTFSITLPEINIEIPKEEVSEDAAGPKLYVRDDGSVDWDGALQDQAALKNFGTAVWSRINGRIPEEIDGESGITETNELERPAVTARIEDTPEIRMERERLTQLEAEYENMERGHLALLNSAISSGQAVANINFATLDAVKRRQINDSSAALELKREELVYQRLIYELERIYTYLTGEMGNTSGYIPLQDRLNVAEFGLLESQIMSFKSQIESGEYFDADVLAVVSEQVQDLKRRLGIDYYVTGLTFDREAIQKYTNELWSKTTTAIGFYGKGCKLLWNDLVFATSLIVRALQGYTLKPREVRNLRRTLKDFITFIPVVIILLIPLSPIGHVLVFGAIQRVFPDFFPSCFREERQNLLNLYESAEYSELTINETFREKFTRFLEAFFFQVAKYTRKAIASIRGGEEDSRGQ